jgi:hypothetical protein
LKRRPSFRVINFANGNQAANRISGAVKGIMLGAIGCCSHAVTLRSKRKIGAARATRTAGRHEDARRLWRHHLWGIN